MKTNLTWKSLILMVTVALSSSYTLKAQLCEWRLSNATYNSTDPDGAGVATGSATFTLQLHTISGTIPLVTGISTGYSYQSARAMVPTTVNCPLASSPSNITLSAAFLAGGYSYLDVNQCSPFSQTGGTEMFNSRAVGTLQASGGGVTLTTAWMDVFTVTLWTLNTGFPQGGYVSINSTEFGTPNPFSSYAIADQAANQYEANSLTFTTPLALGGALPVLFTKFDAKCTNTGTLISWATAQEANSSKFEIERSNDGNSWTTIGTVAAAGNSSVDKNYQQLDLNGGTAFYRIKQTDKDGQFIYTNVERTNCQVKNISSVIYPVPAKDILNVVIKSDRSIRTQLLIFDMQGKMVKKMDASITSGNNNFRVNLSGLVSGDYLLRTNDATIEINKVFTIVK